MSTLKTRQNLDDWTPLSWREFPVAQAPAYPDPEHLERVTNRLSTLPPLVSSWEVERLRERLAEAAVGKRFVLQGGDCAETFADCTPGAIANKLKILLQMSLVLVDGLKLPIVRIGRIAGQYAKPRSSHIEKRGEEELTSYFGDLINGAEYDRNIRTPDPERLLLAYYHSSMSLNFIRALIDGGFADLHHPEYWDLDFLGKAGMTPEQRADYTRRVGALANSVQVMEIIAGRTIDKISSVEFYTSHEGLSLPYESAVTRTVPRRSGYYNMGCHLPWIGERTRALDGAHVEFFRGIRNPIGIKIGPKTKAEDLLRLARVLDPDREPGRLVIIGRFGAENVRRVLPNLVESIAETGRQPVWMCDPMHGNTTATKSGIKTRHYENVLEELLASIDIHEETGSVLGGVHFELTAENVTECIGGASGVTEDDLTTRYETLCDPRLNYEQAMEMAFAIARRMEAKS
ncbi:MAG: 3-deoxy-7-phosphoheptulonate synthase [Candidatus Sumerlaeia bacterium]|nr:3-deoxy-7-phosphoheptulonate synthase [Candidatus Sumerlaeia bacterium]